MPHAPTRRVLKNVKLVRWLRHEGLASLLAIALAFAVVLDAVAPGQPVHVLAHDWGSTGIWEYLSRPAASDRVASFTSVSGPSGDHMNRFIIGGLKRPYRPRRFLQALDQLLRFSYMGFFSIPVLAPLVVRTFLAGGLRRMLMIRDGIPADRLYHSDTYRFDAANSLKVYRANYFKTIRTARTHHYVEVPVQVIVSSSDPHVRPHVYEEIRNWVPRLWRRDIKAGHWVPMSHPQVLANSVAEFIDDRRLGPAFRFFHRHRVTDEKGKVLGYKDLDELRQKLRPVLLRRTRNAVMKDLPPRTTEWRTRPRNTSSTFSSPRVKRNRSSTGVSAATAPE